MIKIYQNGNNFLEENRSFLEQNKHQSVFFLLDSPLLKSTSKTEYAIQVKEGNQCLLALKVEPYDLLLYGDKSLVSILFSYLVENQYEFKNFMGEKELGDSSVEWLKNNGYEYKESLAMDFMICNSITEESSNEVLVAQNEDIDEIVECLQYFVKECNLEDIIKRENIEKTLNCYRVIKENQKVVSISSISKSSETEMRIAAVYTRKEARGKGYARKLVNTSKNEIIQKNMIATLNVDRNNPITNHLYRAIGFKPLFSHSEYRSKHKKGV